MRVVVLGGGVVGVTTAYYLAKEGHEVELVERQPRLAQDASSGWGRRSTGWTPKTAGSPAPWWTAPS